MIEKIDLENVSLEVVAKKINEIIPGINIVLEWRREELEKDLNQITYGKRITNEQKIADMKIMATIAEAFNKKED